MSTPAPDKPKKAAKKKPTRAENTAAKMAMVRELVNEQASHGEIKRRFASKFKTTPRAAERFITDVYAEIRQATGKSPEDHRADSYAYWQGRVSDTTLPGRERDRARENLDRILGVHAPIKTATTDTAGKDVAPAHRLTLAELDAELARFTRDDQEPPCAASPQ